MHTYVYVLICALNVPNLIIVRVGFLETSLAPCQEVSSVKLLTYLHSRVHKMSFNKFVSYLGAKFTPR
jgi:hypothetical protein